MIRLHLLGYTQDLKGLVFSGRKGGRSGTYWLPANDTLLKALDQLERAREERSRGGKGKKSAAAAARKGKGVPTAADILADMALVDELGVEPETKVRADGDELPLPRPAAAAKQSKLPPREIQRMLREGRSVKDVAQEAGVDEAWVERFTGPVREEKAGVIRMTQEARQSRPRLGPSGLPIGLAVVRNLEERKATMQTLEQIEDGWEARRMGPRLWRVRLRFQHRGGRRMAEWELRKDRQAALPKNKLANELGWFPPDEQEEQERPTREQGSETASGQEQGPETEATRPEARRQAPARRKPSPARKKKPAARAKTRAAKSRRAKPSRAKRGGTGGRAKTSKRGKTAPRKAAKKSTSKTSRRPKAGKAKTSRRPARAKAAGGARTRKGTRRTGAGR